MRFSQEEMTAILKLAKLMAMADGKVTEGEINCIFADLLSFGVTVNNLNHWRKRQTHWSQQKQFLLSHK